jgi:hypothetical protein
MTGLRNAIDHGDSLQSAIHIMIGSGYDRNEVYEASKYVGGVSANMQAKPGEEIVLAQQKGATQQSVPQNPQNALQQTAQQNQMQQQPLQSQQQMQQQNSMPQQPLQSPQQMQQQPTHQNQMPQQLSQSQQQIPPQDPNSLQNLVQSQGPVQTSLQQTAQRRDTMQQPVSNPQIRQTTNLNKAEGASKKKGKYKKEIILLVILVVLILTLLLSIFFRNSILGWFS